MDIQINGIKRVIQGVDPLIEGHFLTRYKGSSMKKT